MEYNELEKLWQQYDSKLNHLEKLNKKLIVETLSKKHQKKINWLQYRNYYGIIIGPVVLIFSLYPQFNTDSMNDPKFVTGVALLSLILGYLIWHSITLISKLKKVDLLNSTVIESASRMNEYKKLMLLRAKSVFLTFPVTLAGVVLIGWEGFHFDRNFYLLIVGLTLVTVLLVKSRLQQFKKKIDILVNDINELKEYKE